MKTLSADVAVIGAGTAGLTAFRAARSHGKHVVLIEGGEHGTTCARVGCMPSKLLIAAAEARHSLDLAKAFGIHANGVDIDGQAVMARVRSERDRFVGFVTEGVRQIPKENCLQGHAAFVGPNKLRVGQHTLVEAGAIVIATGSRPVIPKEYQQLGKQLLTSEDIFECTELPESVAVVGTGVVGLELGQALHRLGVRVTLFGHEGRLAQLSDEAVLEKARDYLGSELDLRLRSRINACRVEGSSVLIESENDGVSSTDRYQYVLVATGRRPNLDRLDLALSGLELDDRGIPLFDPRTLQCGNSAVFIAGDANNERPVLHEATHQGRIAGDNAGRYPDRAPENRHAALSITFTDPQIAMAGHSFRDLEGKRFAIGEVSFEDQGRSRVMHQNRGLLRLYGEFDTDLLLGAEMIGPRAEHLIHLLAWAVQKRMTVGEMMGMPFYHPVIEEGIRTALKDLQKKLLGGLPAIEGCADCTPGV